MQSTNLVDVNSLIDEQPSKTVDVNSLIEQPQKKNSLQPSPAPSAPSVQSTLPSVPQSKSVESNPPVKPLLNTQQAAEKFGLTPIQNLQNQNIAKSDNTLSVPNAGVFNKQVNAFNEVTDKTITGNAPDESVVIRNEYQKKRKGILNPEVVIPASQLTPENNFGLNANPNTPQVADNAVNKIQVKPVQGAPVNAVAPPTPEQEFKQKVSDNLSSLEKETIAKSGEYAMKVTSDPVAAGFITKAILGDNMAISQKRQIDKGYTVPQADLYQTGQVGITSMIAALDKKYESDPQNADYIAQKTDLENQAKNLIDKFPEYKVSQLTKAVAIELGKLHPEVSNSPSMARLYLPEIKKEMGLSDEDIKAIDFDNYPTSNFLTSTIAPIYKGALGLGLSATRAIGSALGADKDLLNSRLTEASQSPTFFDDIETMQNTGQTVDVNKASPTFLQNIADPNKGKYNYNFHTISNAIGNGVGQLAWFVYGTKGAGAAANKALGAVAGVAAGDGAISLNGLPVKLSADATNEVGMAGLMMGQGYEDYYQKARTVISDKPEDEWKRHTFSLINGALDYLGFRVLGNVVKGLPPAAEKEIGQVFKDAPNLAAVNKKALQSKLTDILKGAGEAAKETAFVGSATTASEIAKAVVVNVMGNDEAAKEENAQLPSVIEGSIASLPFSMFIPILGSKIIAGGQSKVHRENIYNAGISPENYKGDAHKLFDMGAINQEQLNDRIQVINTADKVVKSIPSDIFDKLNHNQRVTYVNSKIRELALKAKSENVQDEALSEYYDNQIKGEVAKRSDVLNGGGKEGEFPESVSVIKPKTQEEINNQIPTVTIAPKENTPETKQGVSVVLPQTVERGREMPTATVGGKTNENATEKTTEVPKSTEAASTTNEAVNKVEQPTEESLVSQAKDLVNSGVVKGYTAETLKESANNNPAEFQQHLKDISEQANDPKSNKATVDTYGKELVDIAQKLNPSGIEPVSSPVISDKEEPIKETSIPDKIENENGATKSDVDEKIHKGELSKVEGSIVKTIIGRGDDVDLDNVIKIANKIAKTDNTERGVQHIAEALQYDTSKNSPDFGRVEADQFRQAVNGETVYLGNLERMDELGLLPKEGEKDIELLNKFKEKMANLDLPIDAKSLLKTAINRHIIEDNSVNQRQALEEGISLLDGIKNNEGKLMVAKSNKERNVKVKADITTVVADQIGKHLNRLEQEKTSESTNTEENNPESFKPFEDIVKDSNSVKEAFDKVKKLKGIPADVSEAFRNKYDSEKKLSPEKAFEKFYNEVKGEPANTEQGSPAKGVKEGQRPKVSDKFKNKYKNAKALFDTATKDAETGRIKTDNGTQTIDEYVAKGKVVLNKLFPDATFETYKTHEEFQKAGGIEDSRGTAITEPDGSRRILLNLAQMKEDGVGKTAFHEVVHPIVSEVFGKTPQELAPIWGEIASTMKDVKGMDKVWEHLVWYGEHKTPVEGITEFLTQVAEGNINIQDIPPAKQSKLVDLINKLFERLGINFKIDHPFDLQKFAADIKNAFETGDVESLKNTIDKRSAENKNASENASRINDLLFGKEADFGLSKANLKEAINKSIESVGKLMDKGAELKDAITQEADKFISRIKSLDGVKDLKPKFEKALRDNFEAEALSRFNKQNERASVVESMVKDAIGEGFINVEEIKDAITNGIGVDTPELRKMIDDAYAKVNGDNGAGVPPVMPLNHELPLNENTPFSLIKTNLEKERERLGMDRYQGTPVSNEKARKDAIETMNKWKEDGVYKREIAKVLDDAMVGEISDAGQNILAQHIVDLQATMDNTDRYSKEYDSLLLQKQKAIEAGDVLRSNAGRILGRDLPMRGKVIEKVSDVEMDMMDDLDNSKLTKEQKEEAQKRFDEIKEKLDAEQELRKKAEEEISRLKAEKNVKKERAVVSGKKTKEDYIKERISIRKSIKEKWEAAGKRDENAPTQAGFVNLPFSAKQLMAVAPDVSRLMKSYLQEGTAKTLEEVQRLLKKDFNEEGIALEDGDIRRLIAGEFNAPKKGRDEILEQLSNLKREQKIMNEIDRLENGTMEVSPKREKRNNQRLSELRKRLEVVRKLKGVGKYSDESKNEAAQKAAQRSINDLEEKIKSNDLEIKKSEGLNESEKTKQLRQRQKDLRNELEQKRKDAKVGKYSDEQKFVTTLKQRISVNEKEQNKLLEKLKNKDYAEEVESPFIIDNKELQAKNKDLYDKYVNSLVEKERALVDYEKARIADKLKNRDFLQKAGHYLDVAITTSKGTVAMFDQSVFLVQMLPFTFSHPVAAIKYARHGLQMFRNKSQFEKNIAILHNSKWWDTIQKSGLAVYEPTSAKRELRNELHGGEKNLLNKDIVIGNKNYSPGQAFERSTSTLLNDARIWLFMNRVSRLQDAGKTIENSPKEYEAAARVVNELTGHGKPHQVFQHELVNHFIWSTKMFSSTLNLLGLGDLIRPVAAARGIAKNLGINVKDVKDESKGFYTSLTPAQGKFVAKEMARFIGTGVLIMYLTKILRHNDDDTEVDYDPRSSAFGTIRIGNKTYPIFGRFGSAARTIAQSIIFGEKKYKGKTTVLGERYGSPTAWDVFFKSFVRGKATPLAGTMFDYVLNNKKNYYTKEELNAMKVTQSLVVPLSLGDIPNNFIRDGFLEGVVNSLLGVYGLNAWDDRDFIRKPKKKKTSSPKYTY